MTQPVTLMFVPGSSAIAIRETDIAAAIKSRFVLFMVILRKCCGRHTDLLAERNPIPCVVGTSYFRLFGNLNRSIESIRRSGFRLDGVDSFL